MLAFEFVARFFMIEVMNIPSCQVEILAIVFWVAIGAFRV
jgi:hypothetical protein